MIAYPNRNDVDNVKLFSRGCKPRSTIRGNWKYFIVITFLREFIHVEGGKAVLENQLHATCYTVWKF